MAEKQIFSVVICTGESSHTEIQLYSRFIGEPRHSNHEPIKLSDDSLKEHNFTYGYSV